MFRYVGGEFFVLDVTRGSVGNFILVRHIAKILHYVDSNQMKEYPFVVIIRFFEF